MTAAKLIQHAAARLEALDYDTPKLDAEVLLRHVLGLDRAQLFARLRNPVAPEIVEAYAALIQQRAEGKPVAYLIGSKEFMGLDFAVGPGVLIPRPETEHLVEWALAWLSNRSGATVIDVGTGSGAIIVSLAALAVPAIAYQFIGCDVSAAALAYTTRNVTRHAAGRVSLVQGDLLTWCRGDCDLILANLPYLTPDQLAENRDLHAEPELALVSGQDGLTAIDRLIADLTRVLAPGGAVGIELDPGQAVQVADRLGNVLPSAKVSIFQDLAGFARLVFAQTAEHAGCLRNEPCERMSEREEPWPESKKIRD